MSIPSDQVSPFGPSSERTSQLRQARHPSPGARPLPETARPPPAFQRPHLFGEELCERWHITNVTLSRIYQRLGLRPIKLGKRLLWPLDQVEAVERLNMK